jgi:hypothetical protein
MANDVAEKWRLRALLRFGRGDLAGALAAAAEARSQAPRLLATRFLSAALQYYEGFVPSALPPTLPRQRHSANFSTSTSRRKSVGT